MFHDVIIPVDNCGIIQDRYDSNLYKIYLKKDVIWWFENRGYYLENDNPRFQSLKLKAGKRLYVTFSLIETVFVSDEVIFRFSDPDLALEFRMSYTDWQPGHDHSVTIQFKGLELITNDLELKIRAWLQEQGIMNRHDYSMRRNRNSLIYDFKELHQAIMFKLTFNRD